MSRYPKLWFLRHGETVWNAEKRIQGQLESDLTARGIAQAHQQAVVMEPLLHPSPPCFVSPLGRAQRTAEIALGGRSFATDPRLAEVHAGAWQGLLRDEVLKAHPTLENATALEVFLSAPEGERFDGFRQRIVSFLDDLTEPSVIVAHGLLGQVLRGVICGFARDEMGQLPNGQGCVYVLEDGAETVLRAPD